MFVALRLDASRCTKRSQGRQGHRHRAEEKGRSTAVLDRTDYLQKAKILLEDRQFYVPCETNPVKTLTREINATLSALENSGAIKPVDRRTARVQETALARFYGLPKVQKELAMETVELLLRSKYNETENRLGHAKILQLLKFCLRTYFTSDGTIYEQGNGTPIGSPISGASFRRASDLPPLSPPVFSSRSRHPSQVEKEESLRWMFPMSVITIN
nr:unnamed protein product [Spirometra erinaceieuropaei]